MSLTEQGSGAWASAFNPASTAVEELPGLEFSYTGIADMSAGSPQGWGSAAQADFALPKAFGVWNGAVRLFSAPGAMASMPMGTFVTVGGGFSKKISSRLSVGASASLAMGGNGSFGWGAWVDLGAVRELGDLGFLKNTRLGFVVSGLGKEFNYQTPPAGIAVGSLPATGFPPAFTPGIGFSADLLNEYDLRMRASVDLRAPSFSDIEAETSLAFSFRNIVSLRLAMATSLYDIQQKSGRSVWPSLTLSGRIPLEKKSATNAGISSVMPAFGLMPLYDSLDAFSLGARIALGQADKSPPTVKAQLPGSTSGLPTAYISPNADGVQDWLEIPIKVSDDQRVVAGWVFKIEDRSSGKVVRTIAEQASPPETIKSLADLKEGILFSRHNVFIPDVLRWDGKDDQGNLVPEGTYIASFHAWDDLGNTNMDYDSCMNVVVDRTPPSVNAWVLGDEQLYQGTDQLIFSPDGDNSKDTISFRTQGSIENNWKYEILDANGKAVRTQEIHERSAPRDFVWDGTDDAGKRVPDGYYRFRLSAVDPAGNVGSKTIGVAPDKSDWIVVDTSRPAVRVAADKKAFSPIKEGKAGTIDISFNTESLKNLVSWKEFIQDQSGKTLWSSLGDSLSPPLTSFTFNGLDPSGKPYADGQYKAGIEMKYRNGYSPVVYSEPFILDATPPSAQIVLDDVRAIFSPDGDGSRDALAFKFVGSKEDLWNLRIRNEQGIVVYSQEYRDGLPNRFVWNGLDTTGRRVDDGRYFLQLESKDIAENSFSTEYGPIVVDTRTPRASFVLNRDAFSPNDDGVADVLKVGITLESIEGLRAWKLDVAGSSAGQPADKNVAISTLLSGDGSNPPPATWQFDGKTDRGLLPEGAYHFELTLEYDNGWKTTVSSPEFVLDITPPKAQISRSRPFFNPRGSALQSQVIISQMGSKENLWTGELRDAQGNLKRKWEFKNSEPGEILWDGRTADGALLPDGLYSYRLFCVDAAGNSFASEPIQIGIDTAAKQSSLSANYMAISPNGDGIQDAMALAISVTSPDSVQNWRLAILKGQEAVMEWKGSGNVPQSITWDGTSLTRLPVPDGSYTAIFHADYPNGDATEASLGPLVVDRVAPQAEVKIASAIFSPNGDGVNDTLPIQQTSVPGDIWQGSILDADGKVVRSWTWDGAVQSFEWDGRDNAGNVAADGKYRYKLESKDAAGNAFSYISSAFEIETEKKAVRLTVSDKAFSPNNDGIKDVQVLNAQVVAPEKVKEFVLQIVAQDGPAALSAVRTWKGETPLSRYEWRGETDAQIPAPDGHYAASMRVVYRNGDEAESSTGTFLLDRQYPQIDVKVQGSIFSPDGDGRSDTITIAQSSVPGDDWKGTMKDSAGNIVRSWTWKGQASDFVWDGKNSNGSVVSDGFYTYTVESEDAAGNHTIAGPFRIQVETGKRAVQLRLSDKAFSPNGDGIKDELVINVEADALDRIKQYSLTIRGKDGMPVRMWTGSNGLAREYRWNGTNDAGGAVPDGEYSVAIEVLYLNDALAKDGPIPVTVDRVAPQAEVKIASAIFSPNGDGVNDTLPIQQTSVPGDIWQGSILDADGKVVRSWTWDGAVQSFEWDGRDNAGNVAADGKYRYKLESKDAAGNAFSYISSAFEIETEKKAVRLTVSDKAFSPNNDGIKDVQVLNAQVVAPEKVKEFVLQIVAQDGPAALSAVRTWKGETPLSRYEWRGETDAQIPAPDGHYAASMRVVYRNGDEAESSTGTFLLDRQYPQIDVKVQGSIFSPDGDGRSDTITIAQSSVPGDDWKGTMKDSAGNIVRSWTWKGQASDFVWDGKNSNGSVVSDGFYTYTVESEDAAGNHTIAGPFRIQVETGKRAVQLRLSDKAFSPNGDGIKDELVINVEADALDRIKQYSLTIRGKDGMPVRMWTGSNGLAREYRWNGTNDAGGAVPDGEYSVAIEVLYLNDALAKDGPIPVTVDRVAPQASVKLSRSIFSPNGDGRADTLEITQSSVYGDRWNGQIISEAGKIVRTWEWYPMLADIVWDGKDQNGKIVPDGVYYYELRSIDEAGNSFILPRQQIIVDAAQKNVSFRVEPSAFSPNDDGIKDITYININAPKPETLLSYAVSIFSGTKAGQGQAPVRSWKGSTDIKTQYAWDGLTDAGLKVPDGNYSVYLMLEYANGDLFNIGPVPVIVDTVPPKITISGDPMLFSPNGDGIKDYITITQNSEPGDDWTGKIRSASGAVVRSYTWKGQAKTFNWDGTDANGKLVPNGVYSYEVVSVDAAGNSASASIKGITVDSTKPKVYVTASDTGISPNGDGIRDDVSFNLTVENREGVESWRFSLIDSKGVERSFFGGSGSDVPTRLVWDGRDLQGQVIEDTYTGKLVVKYLKGDVAEASSAKIIVKIAPPKVDITVKPEYFSPDGDGVDDTLTFGISTEKNAGITEWKLEILETAVVESASSQEPKPTRSFKIWTGKGNPPAQITWDGKSDKGELVESATDYPFEFTCWDALGNQTKVKGIIAVDVLVIRDGDRLKIKVPSIVFRANHADFIGLDAETVARNQKVVARIAQILNKFPDYRIRIEGHGNNVGKMLGYSASRIQQEEINELIPLSTERAEVVRKMLVDNGVDPRRLTVNGLGSSEPVVPFTDVENRWKNRRVEFVLIKNQ